MSKVLTQQNVIMKPTGVGGVKVETLTKSEANERNKNKMHAADSVIAASAAVDYDDFNSTSSIIEFLTNEQECSLEPDAEKIFQEVSRLANNNDTRTVDEILEEAERLMQQQQTLVMGGAAFDEFEQKYVTPSGACNNAPKQSIKLNTKFTKSIENIRIVKNKVSPAAATKIISKSACSTTTTTTTPRSQTSKSPTSANSEIYLSPTANEKFDKFYDNLPSESVLSEESIPKDMQNCTITTYKSDAGGDDAEDDATTVHVNGYDTDEGTDTLEEITEAMETMQLEINQHAANASMQSVTCHKNLNNLPASSASNNRSKSRAVQQAENNVNDSSAHYRPHTASTEQLYSLTSPMHRSALNFNTSFETNAQLTERRNNARSASTPDSGIYQTQSPSHSTSQAQQQNPCAHASPKHADYVDSAVVRTTKTYCDKSSNCSPKRYVSTLTSPLEPTPASALTRDHALKQEIELLQEKLKDTEERLESIRIQNDNLSQMQRTLRESNTRLHEESEVLKLDVQHLHECANVLRTELQAARSDRNDALDLQKILQQELEDARQERKRALEQKDKDARTIQDLQRQCREMERILMRKHPDSVSALIVASKNSGSNDQENHNSRKLLEQRIAQLEADAKEQDAKAQQILANVQARFNSVQAKYETHIADLETQVLSLQEINAKLNEKIEYQVRTLDYFVKKRSEKFYNNSTQTEDVPHCEADCNTDPIQLGDATTHITSNAFTQTKVPGKRDHATNTIGVPTTTLAHHQAHSASSSTSSTTNSTPNNSRPNSKQSGLRKPAISSSLSSLQTSKLPISHSDSTITVSANSAAAVALANAKEDAHLLATIRGMRVDLAIKSKALQRITRELDECKKTIRKMQREKELYKAEKVASVASSRRNSNHDVNVDHHTPAATDNQALREALNKYKLLEADYKALHDKRMHDLKTLQTAHERELNSCHETVRILQQRLNERDEQVTVQKRRKVPVDYYALKAKVTSLERRHTEREERLHLLVEALSKGRFNGCLEDLLRDNNNE